MLQQYAFTCHQCMTIQWSIHYTSTQFASTLHVPLCTHTLQATCEYFISMHTEVVSVMAHSIISGNFLTVLDALLHALQLSRHYFHSRLKSRVLSKVLVVYMCNYVIYHSKNSYTYVTIYTHVTHHLVISTKPGCEYHSC